MSVKVPYGCPEEFLFPKLFHIGIVCLLLWQIPSSQRSLGHSLFKQKISQKFLCFFCVVLFFCVDFVFYFIKISEFALPDVMLKYLEYRRRRYDIIQVFKIIHEIDDIDMSKFFTFTDNSQLRGHNLKLNKPRVNKSIRLNSFAMRTIPVWNNLPSEIVNSKTVLEFKTKIDKLWKNARYDLSEIY